MKTSEAIRKLEELKDEFGDLEITFSEPLSDKLFKPSMIYYQSTHIHGMSFNFCTKGIKNGNA